MKEMMIILFSAILVDNFVLSKFLGICSFLGVSKNLKTAMGMSGAVILVMVASTAITWPIQTLLLDPLHLGYLQTLVFILVIAALVQMIEMVMKKAMPPLYNALGIFLPLITTNCAVLGVAILNIDSGYGLIETVFNGVGGALGFTLAIVLFAGIRERLEISDVPKSFEGFPIALITAGLMSIAFLGFSGLVK